MRRKHFASGQGGMALIEGLISILIFSLGILAIVGLQASVLRFSTESKYRADASFLANQSIGRIWGDRTNLANYQVSNETVYGLPNGKRTVAISGNQVTVTITWKMPGESTVHTYSIVAHING
jgi:type IV pilus assembly protein PilV